MKFPKLVPPRSCNADVRVRFFGDLKTDGTEEIIREFVGKCNLQKKTRQTISSDKKLVAIEATALFDGDIAPCIPEPQGEIFITEEYPLECEDGEPLETEDGQPLSVDDESRPYRIYRVVKECNPDNTVNYTRVELTR